WRPIFSDEQIAKMMLICWDVTEKKRLEAESEKREAEHSEQLEIIAQLVNHSREIVEQFISDFSRNLESARQVIEQGRLEGESLLSLMRSLHTIKGAAKQFRLESVGNRAGVMETLVTSGEGDPALAEKLGAEFAILDASLKNMLL